MLTRHNVVLYIYIYIYIYCLYFYIPVFHLLFMKVYFEQVVPVYAFPSESANWGPTFPCLLALDAFDRIAGLYNRYLNSKQGDRLTLTILKSD